MDFWKAGQQHAANQSPSVEGKRAAGSAGGEGGGGNANADDSWGTTALTRINQWRDMLVTSSGFFRTSSKDTPKGESPAEGGSEHGSTPGAESTSHQRDGINSSPPTNRSEEGSTAANGHAAASGANLAEWLCGLRMGLKQQLDAVKRTTKAHDGDFTCLLDIPILDASAPASAPSSSPAQSQLPSPGRSEPCDAASDGGTSRQGRTNSVTFVSHQPLLFACLRHAYNITDAEYGHALTHESMEELRPATSKSGRAFFMTHDKRFILKTLAKSEATFLLDILCLYYEHVLRFPHTLLPWHCGVYTLTSQGREIILLVEANAFSSKCPIHERYDLKGSVVGRVTPEHSRRDGLDPILKDLDLKERVRLGGGWRSMLLKQLSIDCRLLESLDIVDYSLLLGKLHSADFDAEITFNPNKAIVAVVAKGHSKCLQLCNGAVSMLEEAQESWGDGISCMVLDLEDCSPQLIASLEVLNLPTILCFKDGLETTRMVGCPTKRMMQEVAEELSSVSSVRSRRQSRERRRESSHAASPPSAAAGPSVSFFRKDFNGCVSGGDAGDIYYFGIVDVLQPYNFKKQVEHSLKSLVQDRSKMTIVEPSHYSQRFQAFIGSIVV